MKDKAYSEAPEKTDHTPTTGATVSSSTPITAIDPNLPQNRREGQVVDDMGRLSLTEEQSVYTGSSHWVTVLNEVGTLYRDL